MGEGARPDGAGYVVTRQTLTEKLMCLSNQVSGFQTIEGLWAVRERHLGRHQTSDCSFRQLRRLCHPSSCSGACAASGPHPKSQGYRSGRALPGVHRNFHSQIIPPWGERICKRLPSAQIRRRRTLHYSGQLQGIASLAHTKSMMLTVALANTGESTSDRIVGAPGQNSFRITLRIYHSGRCQGESERKQTRTVRPPL